MPLRLATLIPIALALSGCAATAREDAVMEQQPSISEIARDYKSFVKITKDVVSVNPEFAMLCIGATQLHVDSARTGHGPHANSGILIYMNQPAADAFADKGGAFPVGAAIVKEKMRGSYIGADGKLTADANGVGGMVKRSPGYDPAHGDWEYFYFENVDKIERGRIPSCVGCHQSASDRDHVFGTWHKAGG